MGQHVRVQRFDQYLLDRYQSSALTDIDPLANNYQG